ncbi:MAG: 3-hydroxyacyl-CoA dehydrogenase, partial [Acidobacteria bacterium]|nr:3-hydroxyacyl-CoA dehydrogenase [Acidobacteriota bacterium]
MSTETDGKEERTKVIKELAGRVGGVERAAVIGAGTMGGGIAMSYANAGIPVLIRDSSAEALERGMATIRRNYESSVRKGRFSVETMEERLALIRPQLDY